MSATDFQIIQPPRPAPHLLAVSQAYSRYDSIPEGQLEYRLLTHPQFKRAFDLALKHAILGLRGERYPIRVRRTNDPEILARVAEGRARMELRLAELASIRVSRSCAQIETPLPTQSANEGGPTALGSVNRVGSPS